MSIGRIKSVIEKNITGIYVYSIEIGKNAEEDVYNGFFKDTNEQVLLKILLKIKK